MKNTPSMIYMDVLFEYLCTLLQCIIIVTKFVFPTWHLQCAYKYIHAYTIMYMYVYITCR